MALKAEACGQPPRAVCMWCGVCEPHRANDACWVLWTRSTSEAEARVVRASARAHTCNSSRRPGRGHRSPEFWPHSVAGVRVGHQRKLPAPLWCSIPHRSAKAMSHQLEGGALLAQDPGTTSQT